MCPERRFAIIENGGTERTRTETGDWGGTEEGRGTFPGAHEDIVPSDAVEIIRSASGFTTDSLFTSQVEVVGPKFCCSCACVAFQATYCLKDFDEYGNAAIPTILISLLHDRRYFTVACTRSTAIAKRIGGRAAVVAASIITTGFRSRFDNIPILILHSIQSSSWLREHGSGSRPFLHESVPCHYLELLLPLCHEE